MSCVVEENKNKMQRKLFLFYSFFWFIYVLNACLLFGGELCFAMSAFSYESIEVNCSSAYTYESYVLDINYNNTSLHYVPVHFFIFQGDTIVDPYFVYNFIKGRVPEEVYDAYNNQSILLLYKNCNKHTNLNEYYLEQRQTKGESIIGAIMVIVIIFTCVMTPVVAIFYSFVLNAVAHKMRLINVNKNSEQPDVGPSVPPNNQPDKRKEYQQSFYDVLIVPQNNNQQSPYQPSEYQQQLYDSLVVPSK